MSARHQPPDDNNRARRERGMPRANGELRNQPKTEKASRTDARYEKGSQTDRTIMVNCKCGRGELWVVNDLRDPQERESLERVHSGWEGSTIYQRGHVALLQLPSGGAARVL